MSRSGQFASLVQRRGRGSVLVVAFLVCAGLTPLLRAQSSVLATSQTTAVTLPDNPLSAATPANSFAANSFQGSRPIFDPFKPRPKFGISSGSTEGGTGSNSNAGGFRFSARGAGGLSQFGTASLGGRQGNLATFFPVDGFATSPAVGVNGTFGNSPGTLQSLSQLMRANLRAPLGSSPAAFRLSYQQSLGSIGYYPVTDFSHILATGMFTSSDLGNGMFLSAGTGSGRHSMAGDPAASLGNGSGAPKHSGPSVAIKLSF